MHHIYTTEAFVIKNLPSKETNKTYFLFTKDLGLVRATAQSIRSAGSKLKGHLEDFYFTRVSLVKGREVWRITGAESIAQKPFYKNQQKLSVLKNVFELLLRLIHGEEKNENLFSVIETFYEYLSNNELSADNLKNLEVIIVLRVLSALGYLKDIKGLGDFIENHEISTDLLSDCAGKRKSAIAEINNILKETHL